MLRKFIIISIYLFTLLLGLYLYSLMEKQVAINWVNNPYKQDSKLNAYQVYNIATALQNDLDNGKITNHIDWQNKVAGYGGGEIFQYLNYDDNGKVRIYNPKSKLKISREDWKKITDEKQEIINAKSVLNFSDKIKH